jgi:hypothetical protein
MRSMQRSLGSAKGEMLDAPLPPPHDAPSDALGATIAALGMSIDALGATCAVCSSEIDPLVSKIDAGGTTWHKSITSRESLVVPSEALVISCASVVAPRVSIVLTMGPLHSTCEAISVARDSMVEPWASIAPPRGTRLGAGASSVVRGGSIVALSGAQPASGASIVASSASLAGGRDSIVVRCDSIVDRRDSIAWSRESLRVSRASLAVGTPGVVLRT